MLNLLGNRKTFQISRNRVEHLVLSTSIVLTPVNNGANRTKQAHRHSVEIYYISRERRIFSTGNSSEEKRRRKLRKAARGRQTQGTRGSIRTNGLFFSRS